MPVPTPELNLAGAPEIVALCVAGDYLRAALLAAGRAFVGLPEVDPWFEALLVAHHVWRDAGAPPWPDWCYDLDSAANIARTTPNTARLTFLAAQCQVARGEGAADPIPGQIKEILLDAFNDFPDVRQWLTAFREAIEVPGLWEQVCRPVPPDPKEEYRGRRRAFQECYEGGLLHRSDKVAYIRRQDYYLSRQPAFRLLHERLRPDGLATVTAEERKLIESWLEKKPEWVTDTWHESTKSVAGKVKLHGNQHAELVRRASKYLECATRAWQAGHALGNTPITPKDAERLRKQLRDLLPTVLNQARSQLWCPLFRRLTERLPS